MSWRILDIATMADPGKRKDTFQKVEKVKRNASGCLNSEEFRPIRGYARFMFMGQSGKPTNKHARGFSL